MPRRDYFKAAYPLRKLPAESAHEILTSRRYIPRATRVGYFGIGGTILLFVVTILTLVVSFGWRLFRTNPLGEILGMLFGLLIVALLASLGFMLIRKAVRGNRSY